MINKIIEKYIYTTDADIIVGNRSPFVISVYFHRSKKFTKCDNIYNKKYILHDIIFNN